MDSIPKVSFKDTLNLTGTDFPLRPNSAQDDPALCERWQKEGLYTAAMRKNAGAQTFILHDGPPYANGNIHLGHAYNKILKDIITKSRRMAGFHAPITPGWDCHGLPIEIKVSGENPGVSHAELKKACRVYAQKWIEVQRAEFKRLGVVMDWDNPYITMNYAYEAAIMRAFGALVRGGFIQRSNKTIAWCASCQTVLASAEIEYKDRKDPSLFVTFPMVTGPFAGASALIWTTTPWTLPLNRGVMVNPNAAYVLMEVSGKKYIVGAKRAAALAEMVKAEPKILKEFSGTELLGMQLSHPFVENLMVPIVGDDSVGTDEGTALVHTAPGCGPIDYEIGIKNNLEIFSPLSPDGKYTVGIMPQELEGMPVSDGQIWVIKKLAASGNLFAKASITHSYPHCWRCHNGLIFRATPQWFFNLEQDAVKERALHAVEAMAFLPPQGKNFLRATIENRWEWCLSRQRVWGVPIPALICTKCDAALISPELAERVAAGVEQEGVEFWDRVAIADLIGTLSCTACQGTEFKKEQDILDVWFDAGVSHAVVLVPRKEFPADLYLEGIDQHRGWFQSSLLTSMVLEKKACTRAIMTHGFTVDDKGHKMSKSLGNVISPQEIIDKIGTDGLRLWAASIDHEKDAIVSQTVIANVAEVYRKVRNTSRFMLQNLYDFDYEKDAVPFEQLFALDQRALMQLREFEGKVRTAYDAAQLSVIYYHIAQYCAVDLSAFYCDLVKDRLYVEAASGHPRRSAQTALSIILDTLTKLLAPIMSFTAELIFDEYKNVQQQSIHLESFNDLSVFQQTDDRIRAWHTIDTMRSALLKVIEREREQGVIKHPLETKITVHIDQSVGLENFLSSLQHQTREQFVKEIMVSSQIIFAHSAEGLVSTEMPGLSARVERADGAKCPRCWHYDTARNEHDLCARCHLLISHL